MANPHSLTDWLHSCFVADRAVSERLPLPDAAGVKQKFPGGATTHAAQFVVRYSSRE